MQPREIVELVRKGYALATKSQTEAVARCLDVDVVAETWVPRWALEAELAFEAAGRKREEILALFSQGRSAVIAELTLLVKSGQRLRVFEPRSRWITAQIDRATEAALQLTARQHKARCKLCAAGKPCFDEEELEEELELLFPRERRERRRA